MQRRTNRRMDSVEVVFGLKPSRAQKHSISSMLLRSLIRTYTNYNTTVSLFLPAVYLYPPLLSSMLLLLLDLSLYLCRTWLVRLIFRKLLNYIIFLFSLVRLRSSPSTSFFPFPTATSPFSVKSVVKGDSFLLLLTFLLILKYI